MAGITWNERLLRDRARSLQGLQMGLFKPRLAQLISLGGVKLTMDVFRNQRDPYGKPWAPLARERTRDRRARISRQRRGLKVRGQKILIKTARMRNSTAPIFHGGTGGVGIPVGYAASHQGGAHIPPHSRAKGQTLWQDPETGRFVGKHTKLTAVIEHHVRPTFAQGITIPQRMMLPDAEHGLPGTWQHMIQREATSFLTRWMNKGARA